MADYIRTHPYIIADANMSIRATGGDRENADSRCRRVIIQATSSSRCVTNVCLHIIGSDLETMHD